MKKHKFIFALLPLLLSATLYADLDHQGPERLGTIIGKIDSFDLGTITLNVNGTLVRVPRKTIDPKIELSPGKKLAIALPIQELLDDVVRPDPKKATRVR